MTDTIRFYETAFKQKFRRSDRWPARYDWRSALIGS
jgi:hypothetical protein